MTYLHLSKPLVRSALVLLSVVTLTACSAVEFESDPERGVGGKNGGPPGGTSSMAGGNSGALTVVGGSSTMGGSSATSGTDGGSPSTSTSGGVAGASTTIPEPPPFETFHLRRGPVLGLCIESGQAQEASFTRGTDGSLTLTGNVVRSVKNADLAPELVCPTGTEMLFEQICVAPIPQFQPTSAEQAQLEGLIAALPAGQCVINQGMRCDPCRVIAYDIDARSEFEDCCGEQQAIGFDDAFAAVGDYVDQLISRAETRHDSVRLRRAQGMMGFCAKEGESVDVTLQRRTDGTFALAGMYVKKRTGVGTGCPAGTEPIDSPSGWRHCIGTVASVAISGTETAKLDGLIASLPPGECKDNPRLACDFCSIPTLEFGGMSESSSCCGTLQPAEFGSRFAAITAYIDALMVQYSL